MTQDQLMSTVGIDTAQLSHDTVIVTGGGSGIGYATCDALLGAWPAVRVVAADLDPTGAESLVTAYGSDRILLVRADLRHPESVEQLVDVAHTDAHSVTGLVNCAGNQQNVASIELDLDGWHRILDVHLDATFLACTSLARRVRERKTGAAIVNVSSVARDFGWPSRLPYAVAKAGIDSLTKTLAVEWADLAIRVNAVAPGYVQTPMVQRAIDEGRLEPGIRDLHALRRFAEPNEIARVIVFLLSSDASFVTGEVVNADGGFSVVKLPR